MTDLGSTYVHVGTARVPLSEGSRDVPSERDEIEYHAERDLLRRTTVPRRDAACRARCPLHLVDPHASEHRAGWPVR